MPYTNYNTKPVPFVFRYLVDLIKYRHLCWNLVGSDLRSRFRRSRLGILWAVIMPLGFALMIAMVWGQLFQVESFWQFALYVFSGMLIWEYISSSITVSLDSLNNAAGYLRTSRVPFLVFQIRVPLTGLVVLFFGFLGLVMMLVAVGKMPAPGLHLLLVPAFAAIAVMFVVPICILLSLLGTQFRDLRYITALVVQALFFVSPVMIQREFLARPELSLLQFANPVIPILDLFRAPVLYGRLWDQVAVATVGVWSGGLWILALAVAMKFGRRIVFAI